ncbi:MAG: CRTAC1 family protein [bacterium]|nr:CRTAC1 family protein [bacterium]
MLPFQLQSARSALLAVLAACLIAGYPAAAQTTTPAGEKCRPGQNSKRSHPGAVDPVWLPLRARAEIAAISQHSVFHGFRFTDRLASSGIRFEHRIVDDAAKDYKAVHYDHGNGMAVADVDADGRLDIYFTNQVGANELWLNAGGGRFELSKESDVRLAGEISVTASFGDIDNDGDPDLFVTTARFGNHLFENDGKGGFREITTSAGVAHVGHSSAAVFFDYDRDGLLDLFVTNVGKYTSEKRGAADYWVGYPDAFSGHLHPNRTETSILYRNLGGNRFEDVSQATGLLDGGWSGDASPFDLDEDGWVDLYVPSMQGHDEVWRNIEGKKFARVGREHFPATPWGTMGIQIFDYDNDGRLDIYLTDMHTDMIEVLPPHKEKSKMPRQRRLEALATDGNHVLGNALFHNRGGGRFEEVSDAMNAENWWPWGLSSGDVNADGFLDVFITASMNYPWRYAINSLLLNNQGKVFVDAVFKTGAEPRLAGTAKPWIDLDCSGPDAGHVDCAGETGCITVLGALGSRASTIFDLDQDGDLDIVTNEFNAPPLVLVSNLTEAKKIRYLKVDLVGKTSNRSGFGARVTVTAGGKSYLQVKDGTSGYLSHGDMPLYFGLGDATKVDSVEVVWPSGVRQEVKAPIALNATLTVEEAAPAG